MPDDTRPPRAAAPTARGLLHAQPPEGTFEHERVRPGTLLAPFVAHFWWVRWSVPVAVTVETLPHPTVHITFETGDAQPEVGGVASRRFTRQLEGEGRVFGIKFRPAAFHPFVRDDAVRYTDRRIPIDDVFGCDGRALSHHLRGEVTRDEAIEAAEAFLGTRVPAMPLDVARVRDLVERIELDRGIVRVEQAAAGVGLAVRTLERHFRRFVGVSPKWTIRRYRLMEAAEQLKRAAGPALADLAASLGYFDQAHFARDFVSVLGITPARFAARAAAAGEAAEPATLPPL